MNTLLHFSHQTILRTALPAVCLSSILNCMYIISNRTLILHYQPWVNTYYNNITLVCLAYSIFTIFYLICYTSTCPQHPKNKYHKRMFCKKLLCYCKSTNTKQCAYPLECSLFYKTCYTFFAAITLSIICAKIYMYFFMN